jgi:sirohydrochlorin cobaltochelatase
VLDGQFKDSGLVLVGHGSTLNTESGWPVFQHAAELRRRRLFREVREAFWKQEPKLSDVVASLTAATNFIVPVFISEGYFSERIIPKAMGFQVDEPDYCRVLSCGARVLTYCRPLGSHPQMTEVLLARARGVLSQFPFPRAPQLQDVSLFIAGHGTQQDDNSRVAIERQVELIRARNIFASVHPVFMEEDPRIETCYDSAKTRFIVVVPFFISDGLHVREDIPVLLGEPERLVQERLRQGVPIWRNPTEKRGKLVWYTSGVGTEPFLADVILQRIREAAAWNLVPPFARG